MTGVSTLANVTEHHIIIINSAKNVFSRLILYAFINTNDDNRMKNGMMNAGKPKLVAINHHEMMAPMLLQLLAN